MCAQHQQLQIQLLQAQHETARDEAALKEAQEGYDMERSHVCDELRVMQAHVQQVALQVQGAAQRLQAHEAVQLQNEHFREDSAHGKRHEKVSCEKVSCAHQNTRLEAGIKRHEMSIVATKARRSDKGGRKWASCSKLLHFGHSSSSDSESESLSRRNSNTLMHVPHPHARQDTTTWSMASAMGGELDFEATKSRLYMAKTRIEQLKAEVSNLRDKNRELETARDIREQHLETPPHIPHQHLASTTSRHSLHATQACSRQLVPSLQDKWQAERDNVFFRLTQVVDEYNALISDAADCVMALETQFEQHLLVHPAIPAPTHDTGEMPTGNQ